MLDGAVTFRGSSTITRTRAVRPALPNAHAHAHLEYWCAVLALAPAVGDSQIEQAYGGAVVMVNGELVFDGVAISDTSATARRPSAARAGRPLRLRACGGPAPDRRRVQTGGAVYIQDGAVTFRGSSTITRTRAVRPARRTRARTHLLIVLVSNAVASTSSGT